jgi:hypothetical protein
MAQLASYVVDVIYSLTNCVFCFPNSPNLKINNRSFKLLRLLGEVRGAIANDSFEGSMTWRMADLTSRGVSPMCIWSKTRRAANSSP